MGAEDEKIFRKLDELSKGQARLETVVAELKTKVDISVEQHAKELSLLFKARDAQANNLAILSREYAVVKEFKEWKKNNREEHEAFRKDISSMKSKVALYVGGAIVAFVALQQFAVALLAKG